MSKPKAPKAPDPIATGAAQTGTNVATAIANSQLNNINQVGPDGSLTYTNDGNYTFTDPTSGHTYTIPKVTQTTTLSPAQQAIADQQNAASLNLSTTANDQSKFLGEYLAKPFDGSNDATEARLFELGRKRLDPALADRTESLRTSLSNQGIKLGSTAYDKAMERDQQGVNDAYNQLLLSGHGQSFQEGQAIRNQPINEITALLSGGQVSQPVFGSTNQTNIPTTDYAGLINQNYAQRFGQYQNQQTGFNDVVGGLFGLGAAFI